MRRGLASGVTMIMQWTTMGIPMARSFGFCSTLSLGSDRDDRPIHQEMASVSTSKKDQIDRFTMTMTKSKRITRYQLKEDGLYRLVSEAISACRRRSAIEQRSPILPLVKALHTGQEYDSSRSTRLTTIKIKLTVFRNISMIKKN